MPTIRLVTSSPPTMLIDGDRKAPIDANCCCATGSCCVGRVCYNNKSPAECAAMGGNYRGNGTTCSCCACPQPCPSSVNITGSLVGTIAVCNNASGLGISIPVNCSYSATIPAGTPVEGSPCNGQISNHVLYNGRGGCADCSAYPGMDHEWNIDQGSLGFNFCGGLGGVFGLSVFFSNFCCNCPDPGYPTNCSVPCFFGGGGNIWFVECFTLGYPNSFSASERFTGTINCFGVPFSYDYTVSITASW